MDALTLAMVGAVVLGVALFFHRMMKTASDSKHLPPGARSWAKSTALIEQRSG